jgi:peptidase E
MHDQIGQFQRSFGERDCHPSSISLFRLGIDRVDVREHLMAQDVIYVGGGSLVNLVAIWRAHGLDELMRECWEEGILICGQSAGAMVWFEHGITTSSGEPRAAEGLGVLPGSACVHYLKEPERRDRFLAEVAAGTMRGGLGLEDQTGALFEDRHIAETIVAREGAAVWKVAPSGNGAGPFEEKLDSRHLEEQEPTTAEMLTSEILEFRETLAARSASTRTRRGVGRLD